MTITYTDFAWNVPVDESLFPLVPPEGYQVNEVDYGDPPLKEQLWRRPFGSGRRNPAGPSQPTSISLLDCEPQLIQRFRGKGPAEQQYAEAIKMGYVVVEGSLFAQTLKTVDNWHYAGKDVKLGDAGKPLCWWRKEGGSTYRMIYGDLSIGDAPAVEQSAGGN